MLSRRRYFYPDFVSSCPAAAAAAAAAAPAPSPEASRLSSSTFSILLSPSTVSLERPCDVGTGRLLEILRFQV